MKRTKTIIIETPIKKWQQLSPMQDELAIVKSSNSISQPELFQTLINDPPQLQESQYQQQYQLSIEQHLYEEQSESSSSQIVPLQQFNTVRHNNPESNTAQKIKMRFVDLNRKGCRCKNSKCAKNYCDCHRAGIKCIPGLCGCGDCENILTEFEEKKELPIRVQLRGCNCRKSKCLKKYCECHNANKKCGSLCQCEDCHNYDQNQERRRYEQGQIITGNPRNIIY